MPEAFGLGAQAKRRAERLAELGYVALAGDRYGDGLQLSDLQEAIKRATRLFADPSKSRARARAALDKLASLPQVDPSRLASIGDRVGRHSFAGARARRCAAQRRRFVSRRPANAASRPGRDQGENSGLHRRRRSVRAGRSGQRAGRRDDQGQGGLADLQATPAPCTASPIPRRTRSARRESLTTSPPTSDRGRRWRRCSRKFSRAA